MTEWKAYYEEFSELKLRVLDGKMTPKAASIRKFELLLDERTTLEQIYIQISDLCGFCFKYCQTHACQFGNCGKETTCPCYKVLPIEAIRGCTDITEARRLLQQCLDYIKAMPDEATKRSV